MVKKILYGVGGLIGLFIFIALILPTPEQNTFQIQETGTPAQQKIVASEEVASTTDNFVKENVSPSVSVVKKETTPNPTPAKQPTPVVPVGTNSQFQYYAVTSVVDGDTIKVNVNGTVETLRLIGMDTPETVDPRKPVQCFGNEASNKAKELLVGTKVHLEKDPTQGELDKYGRTLAYIYREDGLFYNKHMIEQGYAHEYTYKTPYKYQAEFKASQKSAQENLSGLWSPTTCNGDTTSDSTTTSQPSTTQSTGKYYTSSHYSAKYYYPEPCDGWKSLSEKYLESFDTLEALLAKYQRDSSPQCQ
jgi:micrococcal nuclease